MRKRSRACLVSVSMEALARQAQAGDAEALNALLGHIQNRIFALASRMLRNRDDGQDATQEILLRIATRLESFRGESAFTTWVHRLAINHLISVRREKQEEHHILQGLTRELALYRATPHDADDVIQRDLLLEEIRKGCTLGMISFLDCSHRAAYMLGEILGLTCEQAARALEIPSATFRKRLSRARAGMICFMRSHYGQSSDCESRVRRRRLSAVRSASATDFLCSRTSRCPVQLRRVLERACPPEELHRVAVLFPCHGYREATEHAWAPHELIVSK